MRENLPQRVYIARVVIELEATGRGPDGWLLRTRTVPKGSALRAVLVWAPGSLDREDDLAPGAGLVLIVSWDGEGGWSLRLGG